MPELAVHQHRLTAAASHVDQAMTDKPEATFRQYLIWSLRSVLMAVIAFVFIWTLMTRPPDTWLAKAVCASMPAMILYVEGWAWCRRLRR